MNANEIKNLVLLGDHKNVKEFLAREVIAKVGGEYSGAGYVTVRAATKREAFDWANAAQATLSDAFKVCRPRAVRADCGFYTVADGFAFDIKVR